MAPEFAEASLERVSQLVEMSDGGGLQTYLDTLSPGEVARVITRLDEEERAGLLILLEPEDAADLLEELPDLQGADLLEDLSATHAAAIMDEMESDERADVLAELDTGDAEAILDKMDPEEAAEARQLLSYPSDTAGGIMVTEFLCYPIDARVSDVVADLRKNAEEYSDYASPYAYVLTATDTLVGVIRLRDLLLTPSSASVTSVMIPNPVYALVDTPLDELEQLFDRYTFVAVPVVDGTGCLAGIVMRGDAEQALGERAEEALMRFSGIMAGEELRTMPVFARALQRMSWLGINLVLSLIAATVILMFKDTVEAIVALAFFIPVIGNMSGCSGNQAVGVSIRELSLGVVKPEDFLRVLKKEIQVGIVNGLVLGIALGTIAFAVGGIGFGVEGCAVLGLVVGSALALNTFIALSLGGLIPLLLRRLNADPALSAPPIVTTLSDMCGFLILLGLAWGLSGWIIPGT
jgi:magnesium transporter